MFRIDRSIGNLRDMLLIIIPAICKENGSPFGDKNVCTTLGLSYVSFTMAVRLFSIWSCNTSKMFCFDFVNYVLARRLLHMDLYFPLNTKSCECKI